MPGPLQGIRVFDLTGHGVGPWATMILAAMGANVIKIESEQRVRATGRGDSATYRGLGTLYMHAHLGKKGVYLDLKLPEGQRVAQKLLEDADVFVENMKWGTVQRLGLGYEDVSRINPRIVYGNYPGWGSTGPLKDKGSVDPIAQAFAGPAAITGKLGGRAEFIRWLGLHDFTASSYIVTTTLLGLLYRDRTGSGIQMESAQQGASIAIQTSRIAEFLATGRNVPRMGSATTTTVPHRAFLCKDRRWLAVGVLTDAQWRGLCAAIDTRELLEDPRLATNPGRVANRDEVDNKIQKILKTKPARWWTIQLRKRKVPVSLFYDTATIPDLPQVRTNRYIRRVRYPRIGTLPFGNLPLQYSKTPVALRPGIWPGQDTERVLKEGWGEDGAGPNKADFGPKGSLEKGVLGGVTVVDTTQGLCGPYASLLLADSGARVIKVEPHEGDYARHFGPPMLGDVSAVFFHLNRNKEGVRLDIRKRTDRNRLLELVKNADVFLEEEGQPRLKRLGLSYEELKEQNPHLIYCTITPFGAKGPLRDQPTAELVLQAMSAFPNDLGVPGEEPVRMGPDMASLGASMYVTNGILGALHHAWTTGEGQHLTVDMLGTLIHQRGITWTSIEDPEEWTGFYCESDLKPPYYGYKTADQTIGLTALREEEALPRLLKALELEEYIDHPLFQNSVRDIMGWNGDANVALKARPIWEQGFQKNKAEKLVELLQQFGSMAAPVNNYKQLFSHPQIEALGMVTVVEFPTLGKISFLRPPWRLYGIPRVSPKPYIELGLTATH